MEQIRKPSESEEYREAFVTIRTAKNCLWWLILISIAVQIASFAAVRFVGVIDDATQITRLKEKQPATAPAEAPSDTAASAGVWHQTLTWILPATKFIALVCGMILIITMLLTVKLALLGQTGGTAGFMGAFFWSLLLWVFLIPWQQMGTFQSTFACGALYNLGDLAARTAEVTWGAKDVSIFTHAIYYIRFLAYPCFTVMLLLAAQARFARGWRRAGLTGRQVVVEAPVNQDDRI